MTLTLKNEHFEAVFLPEAGMNLISFKKNALEVIAQSTKDLFDERFSGLGPLIGPHFHRRNPNIIPPIADESKFPHIERIRKKGIQDPFSHGIARYAPWKAETVGDHKIKAILSGKDSWNGSTLAQLEGQNFKMEFEAELTSSGLKIELSVVSEADSLVGIHYYYNLPNGKGKVISKVKDHYIDRGELKKIPPTWGFDGVKILDFDLSQFADYTFFPSPDPLHTEILLETEEYSLKTTYSCICQENSWQLYHPENARFVCIEPVSSQDPRHPNLTVSGLKLHLEIL